MSGRSPEEREAARLERERRRAAREGRPFPPAPAAPPEPEPVAPTPPLPLNDDEQTPDPHATQSWDAAEQDVSPGEPADAPAFDPQATQQWDIASEWTGEHAAVDAPSAASQTDAAAFEAAGDWTSEHAEAPAHAPQTETFDVTADWTDQHAAIATAPPEEETPLGTRRVAPHEHPRVAARKPAGRGRGSKPPSPPAGGGAARPPASPRPRGRRRQRAFAVVALALIAVVGWFLVSLYQPFAGEGEGRVVVRVPTGVGVSEIGDLLAQKGVVASSFFFRLRTSLAGDGGKLKSGTFTLRKDMSYAAVLEAITKNPPPPPVIRITIPEGRSRGETAPIARQAGLRGNYVAASRSSTVLNPRRYGAPKGSTLEGFLFPATYELKRGSTVKQLVSEQLTAFKQNLATVNLRDAKRKNLTAYDVLVIASMVEREVAVAKERPLVAAVIYNRLHQGIPLGIDATLRFELKDWTHPLRVSQLQRDTPYNTRTHQGLPPGPIGNPGLASIKAAAHPANVPYLFYVVKPGTCGQHAFSSTDAQFERDVARYNQARDAAGGKSPTKC